MNKIEDLFQKRLEQLQSGRPLKECSAGLPEQEAQLLALVAELEALDYPEPEQSKVALQRTQVLQRAQAELGGRRDQIARRGLPRWVAPALAVSVPVVLLIAFAWLAAAGASIWWLYSRNTETPSALAAARTVEAQSSSTPTRPLAASRTRDTPEALVSSAEPTLLPREIALAAVPLQAPDAQSAALRSVRGLVQVQGVDAVWVTVGEEGRIMRAGERVRTGALSSASLAFYDGSVARLGPDSKLSVDELDARASDGGRTSEGARVIVLSQQSGESEHNVVPSSAKGAQYAVNTPSGSGVAQGTRFQVRLTPAQEAHFSVDEGAVLVSHQDATVVVAAGQATVVGANDPPSEPFFRVTGEGEVQEIGSTYVIAGQLFETHEGTAIVGNPQVGDWVRVEGRLLPDNTHLADVIVLIHRSPANRFELQGAVEAIGETEWTIAGQTLGVDEHTQIEAGIVQGDIVHVEGVLLAGGELLAERIVLVQEDAPGMPFEIAGIVQAMGDEVWTISGISIAVDAGTEIEADLAVGDLVEVEGWILSDATWLARSISRENEDEGRFAFIGTVESVSPWVVSSIVLETNEWTEIDPEIASGDTVRVEGRILDDGTWLATEIKLLDEQPTYVEYIGQVESIDPWIVGGVELAVDDETAIEDGIVENDWARVRAQILPDGTWLAKEIERLDVLPRGGCLWFSARVVEISPEQIVLDNGMAIALHPGLQVEGDVQPGSLVMIQVCAGEDGTLTVVRIVVYEDEIPLATPTPQPSMVTICHKPGTPAQQTKLLPESAVQGHLGHGDYLGPCSGDEDLTPVAPTQAPSSTPQVKVEICHKPGTPAEQTKLVPQIDLNDHLEHGDYLGPCGEDATPVAPTQVAPSTPEAKVTICHKPGTPAQQTKLLPESAVQDHLLHGDQLGPCSEEDGKDKKDKKH